MAHTHTQQLQVIPISKYWPGQTRQNYGTPFFLVLSPCASLLGDSAFYLCFVFLWSEFKQLPCISQGNKQYDIMNDFKYIQETICFIQSEEVKSIVGNIEFYIFHFSSSTIHQQMMQEKEDRFNLTIHLQFMYNISKCIFLADWIFTFFPLKHFIIFTLYVVTLKH